MGHDHPEPVGFICAADNRPHGDGEWNRRHIEVLHAEAQDPTNSGLWWLSFTTDYDDERHAEFPGACYVEARGFVHAVDAARDAGCNPGGQVAGWGPFNPAWASLRWRARWCNRLLTKAEAEALPEMDQLPADRVTR